MSEPSDGAAPDGDSVSSLPGMRRFGALFGAVVAPTSFVTGLMYYFGLNQAWWFYAYFGVDSTLLGLGTTDYLVISVDSLFVPMVITAAAGLAAFWGHDLLRARLAAGARPQVLRVLMPALGGIGALLALGGFWTVLDNAFFLNRYLAAAPLSLAIGVVLLAYTLQLRRTLPVGALRPNRPTQPPPPDSGNSSDGQSDAEPRPAAPSPPAGRIAGRPEWAAIAEWAVVFLLIGLSLIWAATDYAASVGRARAQQLVARLSTSTTAILRSERSLGIAAPGVREIRCRNAKSAYPYRYEGLVLVIQSANQYVLLPQSWTPDTGVALVIPRTDSVRLEFVPYAARGSLGGSTC
ncbi:hypothetical protein GCM10011579_087520 [Streptomyces albiflavescens]|uniref:Uncharacterized protein n=1 Tax=Streptomyces albiflavescens TaxID=1623582 RepID=A0A917YF12_9ACTN|nr:hypothetical protein [Streptomyces albiflavescens]GGN91021.1 hypothetical protein GCM10011579_087520 [Streptomyces albiflavescens]